MAARRIIWSLSALCLVAGVSAAEAKTWLDATCSVKLESGENQPFVIEMGEGAYRNSCAISDWPVSSPSATLSCADGRGATLELQGDDVVMGGLDVPAGTARMVFIPLGDTRLQCGQ